MKTEIIFFSLIFILAGCQVTKEVQIQTVPEAAERPTTGRPTVQANPAQVSVVDGPIGSGGGGNSVNGKMFEDYVISISELPEYSKNIKPIIEKLSQSFPELSADLIHLSNNRKWYMMPVSLEQIPNERLGLFVKTKDQIALQNTKEIFIDSQLYTNMKDPKAQSLLILHELIMGVWFMRNQDFYDVCQAWATMELIPTVDIANSKYGAFEKKCREEALLHGHANFLNKIVLPDEQDYQQVRRLTQELDSHIGQLDGPRQKDLMIYYNFRDYKNPLNDSPY